MDGPPIRHGSVLIGSDGRIEAVGQQRLVPEPADVEYSAWPGAVILPGLVNTHTISNSPALPGRRRRTFPPGSAASAR
jgi:cytosine/adenosine deaminase-related metal-dependent hydrolase